MTFYFIPLNVIALNTFGFHFTFCQFISLAVIFNYHKNCTYAVFEINSNYSISYMFRRIAAEATYCCKLGIKLPGSAGKKDVFVTNRAPYSGICNKLGIKLPGSAVKR
jgi:hypothetical protein